MLVEISTILFMIGLSSSLQSLNRLFNHLNPQRYFISWLNISMYNIQLKAIFCLDNKTIFFFSVRSSQFQSSPPIRYSLRPLLPRRHKRRLQRTLMLSPNKRKSPNQRSRSWTLGRLPEMRHSSKDYRSYVATHYKHSSGYWLYYLDGGFAAARRLESN